MMPHNADRLLLERLAEQAGFDEARLISPRPFDRWRQHAIDSPLCHRPDTLLPGIDSIAVLFRRYKAHRANWSQYYVCSNEGYANAKALAEALKCAGVEAIPNPALPHRAAALRSGGMLGKNSLFIHPRLGTRFSIHLLLLKGIAPDEDGEVRPCSSTCSRCVQACPGGALQPFCRDKCIRHYLSGSEMPAQLRPAVGRILGCDICQDCCPHNMRHGFGAPDEGQLYAFDIGRLLDGHIREARGYVGSNYGRQKRLAMHAVLYTAAQHKTEYLPQIKRLMDDDYPLLAEYAAYAAGVLGSAAEPSSV